MLIAIPTAEENHTTVQTDQKCFKQPSGSGSGQTKLTCDMMHLSKMSPLPKCGIGHEIPKRQQSLAILYSLDHAPFLSLIEIF